MHTYSAEDPTSRYVLCGRHRSIVQNFPFLTQTWEDPGHMDEATGCKGDNDPIDVCEIGYRVAKRGEVLQVKVGMGVGGGWSTSVC